MTLSRGGFVPGYRGPVPPLEYLCAGSACHLALSGGPGLPGDTANDGLSYQGKTRLG